jgi:hypothetical protein
LASVTESVPACAGMLIAQSRAIAQKSAMLVPVRMIVDGIVTSAFDASCIRLQEACHDKIGPRFVCRRGYND